MLTCATCNEEFKFTIGAFIRTGHGDALMKCKDASDGPSGLAMVD